MAAKAPVKKTIKRPTVAIMGAGSLATFLAVALDAAGFTIAEIVGRDSPRSLQRARSLATRVGARGVTTRAAALDATLLWFCVPDREIGAAASALGGQFLARKLAGQEALPRFALHSSGALCSSELDPLRPAGVAVASAHPLMTFVGGSQPSLTGVPFALEGDDQAMRVARRIVRELGGESFRLPKARKADYHAWATMTSPLFIAFLVTLEEAAHAAGFTRKDARRKSLPIIRQTLANYARLGPARSFSGPLVRGDAKTVAKHLSTLKRHPGVQEVYVALARAALRGLPVKDRNALKRLVRA